MRSQQHVIHYRQINTQDETRMLFANAKQTKRAEKKNQSTEMNVLRESALKDKKKKKRKRRHICKTKRAVMCVLLLVFSV